MNAWGIFAKLMYEGLRVAMCEHVDVIDEGGVHELAGISPIILAANHLSHGDTPLIFSSVSYPRRSHMRIVASKIRFREADPTMTLRTRLDRWLMNGLAVHAYRAILVGGDLSPLRSIDEMSEAILGGTTVVVFPEGTRSRDGRLGPLRSGVAVAAIAIGCRVVPVRIDGTGTALPKSAHFPRPFQRITIRFRPALTAAKGESVGAFLARLADQLQPEVQSGEPANR